MWAMQMLPVLQALALYMGHSIEMQRGTYDRRTKDQKVRRGGAERAGGAPGQGVPPMHAPATHCCVPALPAGGACGGAAGAAESASNRGRQRRRAVAVAARCLAALLSTGDLPLGWSSRWCRLRQSGGGGRHLSSCSAPVLRSLSDQPTKS